MADAARMPVIVGIGDINDRPGPDAAGLNSVELMAAAARLAEADAGGGWFGQCDWVAITPQISYRSLDVPKLLPAALGIAPASLFQAAVADGDSPVRHLNDAANAIGAGTASVCLLVGGEALRTAARDAAQAGRTGTLFSGSAASAPALRRRYGLITPAELYPFYENACRAEWGQSLAQAQAETGEIWSRFSEAAAGAQGAWLRRPRSAQEITEISADNRMIAFPYSKLMVANPSVNQGAALIVTSLAAARQAGIEGRRLVHIGAGAAAHEDADPLARAAWTGTPSMQAVLEQAMARNRLSPTELDHVELYSCFPCVPKMARRALGLPADRPLSVHGGLTFGGGPIGNYMLHAAVEMVRKLRIGGRHGLLYGNGGHCTHNHAIVLADRPLGVSFPQDYHCQALADSRRGPIPEIGDAHEGPARIETYTVFYDRQGAPLHAVIIARDPEGRRVLAKVEASDTFCIDFLTDGAQEPVGVTGQTIRVGDILHWQGPALAS